jgi:hypothetical protein
MLDKGNKGELKTVLKKSKLFSSLFILLLDTILVFHENVYIHMSFVP